MPMSRNAICGLMRCGERDRHHAVGGDGDVVAVERQHQVQHLERRRGCRRRPGCGTTASGVRLLVRDQIERAGRRRRRQPDRERAALARPVAPGLDRSAVQLDQPPRQREPDAEAAVAAIAVAGELREHVEDVRQHLRRNADARVLHAQADVVALGGAADANPSAARRVLDRRCSAGCEAPAPAASGPRRSRAASPADRARARGPARRSPAAPHRPRSGARARRSIRSRRISSLFWVMRATSSRSSVSRTSCSSCRSIVARAFSTTSGLSRARRMTSSALRIGASGLRSSCDSVARNSSLRRSASRSASSASF